jgi:hypothetical protein
MKFSRAIWRRFFPALRVQDRGQEFDAITAEQIGAAVRLLYGSRNARRKRQRKRRHVSYKQRDEIAWLLLRMYHERRNNEMSKTRAEWITEFTQNMKGQGSDYDDENISAAAEEQANDQQQRSGSEDAALWQNPAASARSVLNEWNADEQEAGQSGEPGRRGNRPGLDEPNRPGARPDNDLPGGNRPGEDRPRPGNDLPGGPNRPETPENQPAGSQGSRGNEGSGR